MLVNCQGAASIPIVTTRTACRPPPVAAPDILFNKDQSNKLLDMPMPLDTVKTLQDLEITGAGAGASAIGPQPDEARDTQQYEQQQPIGIDVRGGHGQERRQQPAQTIGHHPHPHRTAAPHPAALQAHPSEQPHSTSFYPPLIDHRFAFDSSDGAMAIDPALLDARFDHPAVSGHGGGAVPGFQQGAPQPLTCVNMDDFMMSPTAMPQYYIPPAAPMKPGMSSFEPLISTTWSMDGSLSSTSASSRGLTTSSSISVPSTSTRASGRSPATPGKVGPVVSSLPPGEQHQPHKKRRQTVGPRATGTQEQRSHRNNSSPGFTTPPVPIAPAPIAMAGTSDGNQKNINKKKDSGGSRHQEKTKTKTTPTTTSNNDQSGPAPQPGSSTSTSTTTTSSSTTPTAAAAAAPGQAPDPRARNREAANRCRAKSKVTEAELEATERAMGMEHEALAQEARHLRDEVLALKNALLAHGNCDDELIQGYLTNSARLVGSGIAAMGPAAHVVTTTTTTTTTAGGLPGLSRRPPAGVGVGVGVGGGGGGSSAPMMPSAAAILPSSSSSSSAAGAGATTTTARGRIGVGGRTY